MNATKKANMIIRIHKMTEECDSLIEVCFANNEGYAAACLEDARRAFELIVRRLQGESTLVD